MMQAVFRLKEILSFVHMAQEAVQQILRQCPEDDAESENEQ